MGDRVNVTSWRQTAADQGQRLGHLAYGWRWFIAGQDSTTEHDRIGQIKAGHGRTFIYLFIHSLIGVLGRVNYRGYFALITSG